jgi:hypothetical protein
MNQKTAWHERIPLFEEEARFKKLLSLHSLTHRWTDAIAHTSDDSGLRIERMPSIKLKQNLWLLEKTRLDEVLTAFETLVSDQSIPEFLTELNETIWLIQISALENAFSESKDPSLLLNLLKNVSWDSGKKNAESTWVNLKITDLNAAYQAFLETHVDASSGFLRSHVSDHELTFHWVKSPLQNATLLESPQIDKFCALHQEWIHGFFYGLSRNIQVRSEPSERDPYQWIDFTLLWTY